VKSSTLTSSIPQGRGTAEVRRILCPTDFSEFSDMAFRYALSLAQHYRAKLFVQHVVELWRHPEADFTLRVIMTSSAGTFSIKARRSFKSS
jgi:nucleotide-binding universal stress UspA family protein